jgi:hypothetical protein
MPLHNPPEDEQKECVEQHVEGVFIDEHVSYEGEWVYAFEGGLGNPVAQ